MKKIATLYTLLLLHLVATAQLQLPSFFSDHMILQQQQKVAVWGSDRPNTTIAVTCSWGATATTVTDANGRWKVRVVTPQAGGPYYLEIKGSNTIQLQDVLIGEVWFCSGQSNMEMPMKGWANQPIEGGKEAILNSGNNAIRFFNATKTSAIAPQFDVKGKWQVADSTTTGNASATAYFFARKLQAMLKVPVGILHTSWGASTIESWMDAAALQTVKPSLPIPQELPGEEPNRTPTIMYNAMLHPFVGYGIKGFTWYQGEANRANANEYQALFSTMISTWRTQWGIGKLPFYFVQIAPFGYKDLNAGYLREAQQQTMLTVPNTGMVVTLDVGEQASIHPRKKQQVGERLAALALAETYHQQGVNAKSPLYKKAIFQKNGTIVVQFKHARAGLKLLEQNITGFEIAGEDQQFYPAFATVDAKHNKVKVWSEQVKTPVAVRYCFQNWCEGTLFSMDGIPAAPFRTDAW